MLGLRQIHPRLVSPLVRSNFRNGGHKFQLCSRGRYPPVQIQTGLVAVLLVDAHLQHLVDAAVGGAVSLVKAVQTVDFAVATARQRMAAVHVAGEVAQIAAGCGGTSG